MKILTKLIIILLPAVMQAAAQAQTRKEDELLQTASEIHDRIISIDSHTDTPLNFGDPQFDLSKRNDPESSKVDFPRMKDGRLDGAFFAVFTAQGERTDSGNQKAYEDAVRTFGEIKSKIEERHESADIALTSTDAESLKKEGKAIIFMGMENGYPLGRDASRVGEFYKLGARYITLCHTKNNDICDSSTDDKGPEHDGLSEFGKSVVREMNRAGMMIDVSHASDKTVEDVLALSDAPVIASHSCVKALCDDKRNLPDELIKKIAEHGGVIQICAFSSYLKKIEQDPERTAALDSIKSYYDSFAAMTQEQKEEFRAKRKEINKLYPPKLASVKDLADHIDHAVKIAGTAHVGIGTDFDGGGGLSGCSDAGEMINITEELLRRGYSEKDIKMIWGGNLLRVMNVVQQAAASRQ